MIVIVNYSHQQAIDYILSKGWKLWYPKENVPLKYQYFWDGNDQTCGFAWGAAIKEIKRRENGIQLSFMEI
jgi:hypothetical protein